MTIQTAFNSFVSKIENNFQTLLTALSNKANSNHTHSQYLTSHQDISNLVTTNTTQDITADKTFVGAKRMKFKQSSSTDSIGFTCYNNTNGETAYFEYNNKSAEQVNNTPVLVLGNYATDNNGITYLGFANYSRPSSAGYKLIAPLVADAKTDFNLTSTYKNFYMPLGFKNDTTLVLSNRNGVVDLSNIIPDVVSSVSSTSTNTEAVGAKLFYDTVGDIETALNTINSGVSS